MTHSDHQHGHDELRDASTRRLGIALAINLVFLVVEVIGGLVTNSLALLADAGHMLTDVGALAIALLVARLARTPSTPQRTFGLLRAEVIGAFVNGATLVLVVGLIFREAVHRLGDPGEVDAPLMLLIAGFGLGANLVSAWVLAGSRKDNVNVQGAFLHMVGDALGSVGAMVAGAAIWISPSLTIVDPIASMVIGAIIMYGAVGLLRRTMNILLEATPDHIDYTEVKKTLLDMEHIADVHDLHIWTITSGMTVLTAHVSLDECCQDNQHWQEALDEARRMLMESHGVNHVTLQVEPYGESCGTQCECVAENGDE